MSAPSPLAPSSRLEPRALILLDGLHISDAISASYNRSPSFTRLVSSSCSEQSACSTSANLASVVEGANQGQAEGPEAASRPDRQMEEGGVGEAGGDEACAMSSLATQSTGGDVGEVDLLGIREACESLRLEMTRCLVLHATGNQRSERSASQTSSRGTELASVASHLSEVSGSSEEMRSFDEVRDMVCFIYTVTTHWPSVQILHTGHLYCIGICIAIWYARPIAILASVASHLSA